MKSDAKLNFAPTHLYLVLGALGVIAFTMHDAQGVDWPVHGYYYLIQNMSEKRAEEALEQFSDKATFIDDKNCQQQTPCIGKDAIRSYYIKELLSKRIELPLFGQHFDGPRLVAKSKITREVSSTKCVAETIGIHSFEFEGKKISALQYHVDPTYPGFAEFLSRPLCKETSRSNNQF